MINLMYAERNIIYAERNNIYVPEFVRHPLSHEENGQTINHRKHLGISLIFMLAVILIGALGYAFLDKQEFLAALWKSFQHVFFSFESDTDGKAIYVSFFLRTAGLFAILYLWTAMLGFVLGGELEDMIKKTHFNHSIHKLHNHFILAGCGRVGRHLLSSIASSSVDLVVIERDERVGLRITNGRVKIVVGNALSQEVLKFAGIERAQGLIAALPDDKDNVVLILKARNLNPDLFIVTRCEDEEAVSELNQVGADHIILPEQLAGREIARDVLHFTHEQVTEKVKEYPQPEIYTLDNFEEEPRLVMKPE